MSTQSLEVGADLDLAGLVTELASGPALAQRAGRVNRLGKRAKGPVTVIVPDGPVTDKTRSGPYSDEELEKALAWVTARAADPAGLAPWAVRQFRPPAASQRRTLYQRPELGDAWHWARTSDDLAAAPELGLWLSDSLQDETSVGIVVRDAMPVDPAEAVEFVRDLPPSSWETFPVPFQTGHAILAELLDLGQAPVRVRGDNVASLGRRPSGRPDIRPGDVMVADSSAEIFTRPADHGFSPQVVAAPSSADAADGVEASRRGRADDVLHHQPDPRPGSVVLRVEWSPSHERIAGIPAGAAAFVRDSYIENFERYTERTRRDALAEALASVGDETAGAARLLRGKVKHSDVIVRQVSEGGARVVVVDRRRAVADEDLRQVFTPRDGDPVLLSVHQQAVGARGRQVASALRLPPGLVNALRVAGEHHDDGKADRRFQVRRLGARGDGEPLAKSIPGKTVRQVQAQEGDGGLPSGWRHEQRSVVDSWAAVHDVADAHPELALRLIGTSHGRGRSGFPHTASELAGPEDTADWRALAAELFDAGAWDELIETTHTRYGVWGCAYLEALFRAADCQVSGEGS